VAVLAAMNVVLMNIAVDVRKNSVTTPVCVVLNEKVAAVKAVPPLYSMNIL